MVNTHVYSADHSTDCDMLPGENQSTLHITHITLDDETRDFMNENIMDEQGIAEIQCSENEIMHLLYLNNNTLTTVIELVNVEYMIMLDTSA